MAVHPVDRGGLPHPRPGHQGGEEALGRPEDGPQEGQEKNRLHEQQGEVMRGASGPELGTFGIFSIIKNYFFAFFMKLITYFCLSDI